MPREQPARWPLYVALVAVVIVGTLAVYEFGFNEASQVPPKDADAGATTPNTGDAASAASTGQPAALAEPPSPLPDPLVTVAPAPVQTTVPGRRSGVPQGELVSANAAADPSGKGVRVGERELYFRFDEESWVEIRDRNDKVIFSKLNRAGSEERVNATPPLKLVVGNARGVRLNYGEQPVNLVPHTGVTVARLTLE
jgi:cytoskeleton protein RodZ